MNKSLVFMTPSLFSSQLNTVIRLLRQSHYWFSILRKFLFIRDLTRNPEIEKAPPSILYNIHWLRQVTATNLSWVRVISTFEITPSIKVATFLFLGYFVISNMGRRVNTPVMCKRKFEEHIYQDNFLPFK